MILVDLLERLLSALSFFYLGVMKILHYPLTKHRLSLALAGPPFLVSLMFVVLTVEQMAGFQDVFISHLLHFWLICMALMFGFAEQVRLSRRMRLKTHVDEYYFGLLDLNSIGLDRMDVISLLEAIGYDPGKNHPGKSPEAHYRDGDDDLQPGGEEPLAGR